MKEQAQGTESGHVNFAKRMAISTFAQLWHVSLTEKVLLNLSGCCLASVLVDLNPVTLRVIMQS